MKPQETVSEWENSVEKSTTINTLAKSLAAWMRSWTGCMPRSWTLNFLVKVGIQVSRLLPNTGECQTKYIGATRTREQKVMFRKEVTSRAQESCLLDKDVLLSFKLGRMRFFLILKVYLFFLLNGKCIYFVIQLKTI